METKEIFTDQDEDRIYGSLGLLNYLAGASERIPPWWSVARDRALRGFWKDSDHLSGTVNTLRDMLVAIPFKVTAKDGTNKAAVELAEEFSTLLEDSSESRSNYSAIGWDSMFGAAIDDYHTTDNGLFVAVEGPGSPDGPLTGPPTKLIHLDSLRCWRTASRQYPVLYTDHDGKRYKLHRTRVISIASMSTPDLEMYGVGFCAVSRCINIAQNLIDIGRYKQEKLGSRPLRGIMHIEGGGGREVKAMDNLLQKFNVAQDNQGLSRFAKIPIFGSNGSISLLDLASLPDGFNEMESTQLAMSVLALAFGVDTRQLSFSMGVSGQTKADAMVQHLKMRGKGPGVFLQMFRRQVEAKVLPPELQLTFDYQDDEQDRSASEIRKTKAEGSKIYLETGITNVQLEQEKLLEAGDLTQEQYDELRRIAEEEEAMSEEETIPAPPQEAIDAEPEPEPEDIDEEDMDVKKKSAATFKSSLNAVARALWKDQIDIFDFLNGIQSAISRGYEQAWQEGAAECFIRPEERTVEENNALVSFIYDANNYAFQLGEFIEANRESPWSVISNRLSLWSNRYEQVKNKAKSMSCADQKLEWVLGDAEHCSTCLKLSGRVMRGSRWEELDIYPRDTRAGKLECRGFRCQCELVPTDKKITPGRLPRL